MKALKICFALLVMVLMVGSVMGQITYHQDSDGNIFTINKEGTKELSVLSLFGLINGVSYGRESGGVSGVGLDWANQQCNVMSTSVWKNSVGKYCVPGPTDDCDTSSSDGYCKLKGYTTKVSDCGNRNCINQDQGSTGDCSPNTGGCRSTYYEWTCYDDGSYSESDCRDKGSGYVCVEVDGIGGLKGSSCKYIGTCSKYGVVPGTSYCDGNYLKYQEYTSNNCNDKQPVSELCQNGCSNNKCNVASQCTGKEGQSGCSSDTDYWSCTSSGSYFSGKCNSGKECKLNSAGSAVCDYPSTDTCKSLGYPIGGCTQGTSDKCYSENQKMYCQEVKAGTYCWRLSYCENCDAGKCEVIPPFVCESTEELCPDNTCAEKGKCPPPSDKICCYNGGAFDEFWNTDYYTWTTKEECDDFWWGKEVADEKCPPPHGLPSDELNCEEKYSFSFEDVSIFSNKQLFAWVKSKLGNPSCSVSRTKEDYQTASKDMIFESLCSSNKNCDILEGYDKEDIKCVKMSTIVPKTLKQKILEWTISVWPDEDPSVCLADQGFSFQKILDWIKAQFNVSDNATAWLIFGGMIVAGLVILMLLLNLVSPKR